MRTIHKYSVFLLLLIHLQQMSKAQKSSDTLILTNKGLKEIPDSVFLLTNLRELDLGAGWFAILPDGSEIRMENQNSITTVSAKIGNLRNLEYLDLSSNDITILPKEFVKLQSLSTLGLSGNVKLDLESTIKILKGLPKLRKLVLTGIPGVAEQREKIRNELPHVKKIWFTRDDVERIE